jgi:TRAP-type C4-dicarboxylate transport system substrate-binding protein
MDRRNLLKLGGLTAAATVLGFERAALAQQKLVLKATDVHPLGYPTVEAVVRMARRSKPRPVAGSASRCTRRCNSAARRK